MTWSVTDYLEEPSKKGKRCTGMHEGIEQELLRLFPPEGQADRIVQPTVVVDCNGVILLWFLPGLLTSKRKVTPNSVSKEDKEFI